MSGSMARNMIAVFRKKQAERHLCAHLPCLSVPQLDARLIVAAAHELAAILVEVDVPHALQ